MAKKKTTSSPKRAHILKRESGWAVKKQGAKRATKIYKTKKSAEKGAQKLKKSGHDIVVHKKDGSIEKWQKS